MGIILTESVEDLISYDESLEKNKKQQEYLDYIKNHVLNVQKAFVKFFVPLLELSHISDKFSDEEFKNAIKKVSESIKEHDASKYGDEEFDGYREKYYPTAKEKSDPDFETTANEKANIAWIHHYKNNWHHPKYWIDEKGIISDMTLEAIIEMICDWRSFNLINPEDDTRVWYKEKAFDEKQAMTDKTKELVEEILFNILRE